MDSSTRLLTILLALMTLLVLGVGLTPEKNAKWGYAAAFFALLVAASIISFLARKEQKRRAS